MGELRSDWCPRYSSDGISQDFLPPRHNNASPVILSFDSSSSLHILMFNIYNFVIFIFISFPPALPPSPSWLPKNQKSGLSPPVCMPPPRVHAQVGHAGTKALTMETFKEQRTTGAKQERGVIKFWISPPEMITVLHSSESDTSPHLEIHSIPSILTIHL